MAHDCYNFHFVYRVILQVIVFSDTWHLILEFIGAIHRDYDAICNNNDSVNYSHCDNWFKLLK